MDKASVDDPPASARYLTTDVVAARYGVSRRTIHELTRTGRIPFHKMPGGRRCLFLEDELREWEATWAA